MARNVSTPMIRVVTMIRLVRVIASMPSESVMSDMGKFSFRYAMVHDLTSLFSRSASMLSSRSSPLRADRRANFEELCRLARRP